MKQNKAIEALCSGLIDGGNQYATNFPGFNSHHIFNALGGKKISINEKVAFQLAYGASMAGKRSTVCFKGTGLNFAADDFLHSTINGVNAGVVVVLTDDEEAVSSPERQDSRPYFDIFGGLWLEPTSLQQAYEFGYEAHEWSEKFDVPVVIRLTNQFFSLSDDYKTKTPKRIKLETENRRTKYVSYWKKRDDNLKRKNNKIQEFVETLYLGNDVLNNSSEKGVLIVGNCQNEISKIDLTDKEILKIFSYPIPKAAVTNFISKKSNLQVFEQGKNYVGKQVEQLLNSRVTINVDTGDAKDTSGEWIIWNNLEKLFLSLQKLHPSLVIGDEGTFTDESTKTIQVCLAMGSSIGIAAGAADSGVEFPWCVVGDTSFLFSGSESLIEAKSRGLSFGVIVIDNGGAKSTGGQQIIGSIEDVTNITKKTIKYADTSESQMTKILSEIKESKMLSILVIKTEEQK